MQEIQAPFRVVSPTTGKPLLEVEERDGNAVLGLFNSAGKPVLLLVAEPEEGAGEIYVCHADSTTRLSLSGSEKGCHVMLASPQGVGLLLQADEGVGQIDVSVGASLSTLQIGNIN